MIATEFRSPVGDASTLDQDGMWVKMGQQPTVGLWRSVNDYGTYYYLGPGSTNPAYHTGVDLNLTLTNNYDADARAPVYAVANGVVTFADRVSNSTWGNLVVIDHTLPDGKVVFSRYGHVETMLVKRGDQVKIGQQIATVGNSFGRFAYHLHFDISETTKLQTVPYDWPGTNKALLLANYSDPHKFILERKSVTLPIPPQEEILYIQTRDGLNLRKLPSTGAIKVRQIPIPFGEKIKAYESTEAGGYKWRKIIVVSTGESGWAAERAPSGEIYLSATDPKVNPPKETTKYTAANLRLRVAASITAAPILTIPANTKLTLLGDPITVDGYVWWKTVIPTGQTGYAAERSVDRKYILMVDKYDPPVVIPPVVIPPIPPSSTKITHGVHIHEGFAPHVPGVLKQMAQTGKMACAVVINDGAIANMLVQNGCKYVLYRVWANEGMPGDLDGSPTDVYRGKDWWESHKRAFDSVDRKVYLQIQNEQNHPYDGYYYLGVMQAADQDGRKIAIFSDSVGNPSDVHEENGRFVSGVWSRRVASGAMRYGKANGHIVCLHQYGRVTPYGKETADPGSAIWPDGTRDDGAYKWYGGRHVGVWRDLIPDDSKMGIIVGEAGPSDAIYRGSTQVISDMRGYQLRYGSDPYILGYAFWTFGGAGNLGFGYSTMDASANDILELIKNA
jgi:hypothetical protein